MKKIYALRYNGKLIWADLRRVRRINGYLIRAVLSRYRTDDFRNYTLMQRVDKEKYWLDKKIGDRDLVDLKKRPVQEFYLVPPCSF